MEKESKQETRLLDAAIRENDTDQNGGTAVTYVFTNTSDTAVKNIVVKVVLADGTVIEKEQEQTVQPGETFFGTAYMDLSGVTKAQEASVSVYAKGQENLSGNTVPVSAGVPDVKAEAELKETETQALITVPVKNDSRYAATVTVKASQDDTELAVTDAETLSAGDTKTLTLSIPKEKLTYNSYGTANIKIEAVTAEGDSDEDNNVAYVSLYKEAEESPAPTVTPTPAPTSSQKPAETPKASQAPSSLLTPPASATAVPAASTKPVTTDKTAAIQKTKGKWKTVKATKGKIRLKWKKTAGADGYQIQYAQDKKFKKKKRNKWLAAKKTSVTLTGLKKKKMYYVRIRAYLLFDGKKVYGKWSNVKKVKVKK